MIHQCLSIPLRFFIFLISPPALISWICFHTVYICVLYIKSITFIYTTPKTRIYALGGNSDPVRMHEMPFTRSKAKSTHSFPLNIVIWAHLHCSMERRSLSHIFTPSQFVVHIYSSARMTWLSCWHESFLFKEIILYDAQKTLKSSRNIFTSLPKFAWPLKQPANQSTDLVIATMILAAAWSVDFY